MAMNNYLQRKPLIQGIHQPENPRVIAPKPVQIPTESGKIQQKESQLQLPAPAPLREITNQPTTSKELIPFESEDPLCDDGFGPDFDFDVNEMLQEIEQNTVQYTQSDKSGVVSTTMQKQTIKKSPNIPLFQNCKIGSIGNIHIHVHKK